jgi:S-adenosylmethionine-diacylglycerol 3-amino-3-carboxypropyl transferase
MRQIFLLRIFMSLAAAKVAEPAATRTLLGKAVHRYKAVSKEGVLERLFTLAFSGLVYPQIWEDPVVDMQAMDIEPHHHVVSIASGGCNALSYLTANPAKITAVDLNRAHVALVRLKLEGLKHLPGWDAYYRFFGEADEGSNIRDYKRHLKPVIDIETRRYWESRSLIGRRRLSHFKSNIYRKGLLGRFIGMGHIVAKAYGQDMRRFLDARSLEEQRQFFDRSIAPLFDRKLVKWVTDRRISLYGLGIPPAQYDALSGGEPMSAVLRSRLERLTCDFPLRENYFAWQAFGRAYAPGASGPLPPYLEERHYAQLRSRAGRVEVRHASLTDILLEMPARSAHRFVLLDAQDWMTDEQLNALWAAITHAAAPGARVIFRTAGRETILPGRINPDVLSRWQYADARSLSLGARDRSSIYGGFHIYDFAEFH